jgi:hypothetical protein
VNLAVVIGVNVAFVVISLTQSHALLTVTQLLLSTFKLFWNSVCVPQLIEFAHSYLGRSDMSTTFFVVQAFVGLFNNIAIPCLVVAVLSPSCSTVCSIRRRRLLPITLRKPGPSQVTPASALFLPL